MDDHDEMQETIHVLGAGMAVHTDSNDQVTRFVFFDHDDKETSVYAIDLDSGWREVLFRVLEESLEKSG